MSTIHPCEIAAAPVLLNVGLMNVGRMQFPRLAVLVPMLAMVLWGCNLITGADGLTVANEGDDGSSASGAQGGAGSGAGGDGQGAGSGVGAGGPLDDARPVDGVAIASIAIYQGVKRPLMQNNAASTSTTPVVAGRPALVRVFYTVNGPYNGQPVSARLMIDGAEPIVVQVTPAGTSAEGNLQSTINFDVPPTAMTIGAGYRVDLLQAPELTTGSNAAATYPTTAEARDPLHAEQAGLLTVTLVPVQYNADGSGRLPDTSAAQLERYADLFYAMYPVAEVAIQVRPQALSWNQAVSANGNGWNNLLDAVADLRNNDNVSFNNYYYGIFSPAATLNNYCNGGCVLGLGFVGGPSDDWSHSAIGIGFGGDAATETAVHELGHNHGREHAPCGGVSGADPSYPYTGAGIGSWGYNILNGELYDPADHTDLMSYCSPAWISDYNYRNIFERVQFVNGAQSFYVAEELLNRTYARARLNPDGSVTWLNPITLERPPFGEPSAITVDTEDGPEETTGSFIRYDHIDGGVLFIPPTTRALASGGTMVMQLNGVSRHALIP